MKELNERKAAVLYDYLDSSSLFYGLANADSRSLMNMRASLYNAMPIEGVQHLVDFMREFENSGDYYAK